MPGFLVTNLNKYTVINTDGSRKYDVANVGGCAIQTQTLKKFEDDKVFTETNDAFIVTEGLLLNSHSLYGQSKEASGEKSLSLAKKLINGIKSFGNDFFSTLYGSYSGAFFDKANECWTIWTNHTGDSTVFWYHDPSTGKFCAGSQFDQVLSTLRLNDIAIHFDESAANSMITYAFMCDERTYAKEIKRLFPGTCISISGETSNLETYWKLDNNCFDLSAKNEEEIIEKIDELFREGIKLEFEKDKEYGYSHIADVSGGFDARMVNFVADSLGYKPVLNLHYSQGGSLEERLSRKIAATLGNEIKVNHLDDIEFIYDIEALTSMNFGLAIYSGSTGGKKMLSSLDFEKYGIEHTGMIGDVVIGTFINDPKMEEKGGLQFMYSDRMKKLLDKEHLNRYPNLEMQLMYIRALLGACTSYMIRKNYTEPISVFMYPPLLEYCMSIPTALRRDHYIYKKWVLAKYPAAANIPWDHIDAKITTPATLAKLGHKIKRIPAKLLSALHLKKDSYGMNPHQYWWDTKPEFRTFCQKYFDEHIKNPVFSQDLRSNMTILFNSGNPIEKLQVMTVLAVGKLYFS